MPGHPNQRNEVDLVNPEREVTSPPLETEDWNEPSTFLMERGRRFETTMRLRLVDMLGVT
jgi:hypothetical protein